MADQTRSRGPWTHRALVWVFSIALGLLTYWLLGFLVNDIATWPGPEYAEVEERMLDPQLVSEQREISEGIAAAQLQMNQRAARQNLLRDSTASSRQTMNQLLEVYRLALEKNVEPTEAEQQALAEAQQLFLANQKAYQQLNQEITQFQEERQKLEDRGRALAKQAELAREPIREEYMRLWQWHQYKLAAAKLALLLPLLLVTGWLFLRGRYSIYAPMIYAVGIALAIRVTVVMHDHFPARYFKYIVIVVAIAIVVRILVYLLRMIGQPGRDYLLRQYREAYERFFCPICEYPIRRGPLKYVFWSRRTIKRLQFPPSDAPTADEPYTCPACGTSLFEKCPMCANVRHSLLPVCQHCGTEKPAETAPAASR